MQQWAEIRRQPSIAGRVSDGGDGGPIAGARVTLAGAQPGFAAWLALKALPHGQAWETLPVRADRAVSGADGRFRFIDLPDGRYTVTAEWLGQGSRYGTATVTVTVARDRQGTMTLATADLALPPTRLSGKVLAGTAAVPMAVVRFRGDTETTFTDGQGRYVLSGIEPGRRTLRVEAEGVGTAEADVIVPGRGQSASLDVALGG